MKLFLACHTNAYMVNSGEVYAVAGKNYEVVGTVAGCLEFIDERGQKHLTSDEYWKHFTFKSDNN